MIEALARMSDMIVEEHEGKRISVRSRRKWEENIVFLKKYCVISTRQGPVNKIMNLLVQKKAANFLII
jgi:uncharacterized protein YqjF (DUF2071 family)